MPKKGSSGAVEFWESVSKKFGHNDHVFYELYNEPHNNSIETFLHGDEDYEGMIPMIAAVRKHAADAMLVVAGA
jgi:aryl-phospho-beta-D-glucosidase BglC (GH1 family)